MSHSRLQIRADAADLPTAVKKLEIFCCANQLPESSCNVMKLALDEVLSNIIKYAYRSAENEAVDIELTYASDKFMVSVEDSGVAFNPISFAHAVSLGPLESRKAGGLGILFVKSLLDNVLYERVANRNKITFTVNVRSEQP